MRLSALVLFAVLLALPAPVPAGTLQFDYQGCGLPATLTVRDANPKDVWRQLASQVGFAVRVGTDTPDARVDFSMSGPVIDILAALARYTGAVLVAANDDACLGSRQARTVWLMSEGTATPTALMINEVSPLVPATTAGESTQDQQSSETADGNVRPSSPRRRGQMTAAEREAERERRRQARRETGDDR